MENAFGVKGGYYNGYMREKKTFFVIGAIFLPVIIFAFSLDCDEWFLGLEDELCKQKLTGFEQFLGFVVSPLLILGAVIYGVIGKPNSNLPQ